MDATLHSTYVFNVFVSLQIFNFLNCRKLYDEFNILQAIHRSRFFLIIWFLIVILQILIINFAGRSFGIVPGVDEFLCRGSLFEGGEYVL